MSMIAGRKIRKQPEAGRKVAQAEITLRESEKNIDILMSRADMAMYAQKKLTRIESNNRKHLWPN